MPNDIDDEITIQKSFSKIRPIVFWVSVFSVFTNALMLTGPIYMLQIYDRVLSSQSMQTLLGLTVIIIFLYTCGGLLDFFRSRAMAQAGAILQTSLDKIVFIASMKSQSSKSNSAIRDLESIQRLAHYDIEQQQWLHLELFLILTWIERFCRRMGLPPQVRQDDIRQSVKEFVQIFF